MPTEGRRALEIFERMSAALRAEELCDRSTLHLTANENVMSTRVQQVLSSSLVARYHLGTSAEHAGRRLLQKDRFVWSGLAHLSELEAMAENAFQRCLGGATTDFRPLSGLHSMICSIATLSQPGDTVLSINPSSGGHVATAQLVLRSGRKSVLVDFDREQLSLSLPHLEKLVREHEIRLVFLDEGAPLYPLPFAEIRNIVGPNATIVYDASHALGLLMGGVFGDPIAEGCDLVQGNTHKTFPGPQKAIMHFADAALAESTMATVGEALVSSQHTHQVAALYFAALEMDLFGASYARQVVDNAQALSLALEQRGHGILKAGSRHTESHQVLVKLPRGLGALDACSRLHEVGISVNAKHLYGNQVLRLGVQEVTRRGFRTSEMELVAELLTQALTRSEAPSLLRARVSRLRRSFEQVLFSFDTLEQDPLPLVSAAPTRFECTG